MPQSIPLEWIYCALGGFAFGALLAASVFAASRARLKESIKALSLDALQVLKQEQHSQRGEMDRQQKAVADMLKPFEQRLSELQKETRELEKTRLDAYAGLRQHVQQLVETQGQLRHETAALKTALRKPEGRGRWGEMQLRRVLEMAGMLEHCDFTEQDTMLGDERQRLRPDVTVHLAGGRKIVIDCKTPLDALLDAAGAEGDAAEQQLNRHARQMKEHVRSLATKAYWQQFDTAPDFVVMFVPGEHFLSIALQKDPELLEYAFAAKVIPATPLNLIGLLKTAAHAWRQEKMEENARRIAKLGKELYEGMVSLATPLENLGDSLRKAVEHYNKTAGAFENKALARARTLREEYGVESEKDIEVMEQIEISPRPLTGAEEEHSPSCFSVQLGPKKRDVA